MQSELEVFKDTINVMFTELIEDTKRVCENTVVYKDKPKVSFNTNSDMSIEFVKGGSVSTSYGLTDFYDRVALLNFANGTTPGGGVLCGSLAQEENICRCSNLYASLVDEKCLDDYYMYNRDFFGLSSDRTIYTKGVAVFKDDVTYERIEPRFVDIITCPAPAILLSDKDAYKVISNRADFLIKTAIANKVDCLVLGAWGCGVFGQDPKIVAKCFADALKKNKAFTKVVFAIRACSPSDEGNYEAFESSFWKSWKGGK